MKSKKLLLLLVFSLLLCVMLVACNEPVPGNTTETTETTETTAHQHSWSEWTTVKDASCTEDGSERRDCSVCDHFETRDIDALEHDYSTEWTVDVEPTCTEKGSKSHHCSRCSDKIDITDIPANDHNFGE